MEEGDGVELGVGTGAGAGVSRGGPDGAEPDPDHGAGEGAVVMEEGRDPLRDGEHPLADRRRRQDVVGEVGGYLHHPA
jgi:hypothetical protein